MKSNPLSSKSPAEILALYQRYKAGERVRVLLDELGLVKMADSQFTRLFTNVRINELNCSACGGNPMMAKLPSKSKPAARILYSCQNCGHTVISDIGGNGGVPVINCKCKQCAEDKRKWQEQQSMSFRDKIHKAYKYQPTLPYQAINKASLTELVGLHALVNAWAAEGMTHLCPLGEKLELFWPTQDKSISSVNSIYGRNLLQVDLKHCTTLAFVEQADGGIDWYITRAALIPSIQVVVDSCMDIPETRDCLNELLPGYLSNQQKSELFSLMRAIAVDECVQFMHYNLSKYRFDSDTGEKTEKMFGELLDKLPVNQILVCIWIAVKDAAAFMQSSSCSSRKHAFNSIQGKLRDEAQRRIAGGFESKGFDRNKHCPRSEISFSLYRLLGLDGDVGFNTKLADIPIPDEWKVLEESEDGSALEDLNFTGEELVVFESHGFEVLDRLEATRTLVYSGHEIRVFKKRDVSTTYFEMSVRTGSDDEWFHARLATLDALLIYLGAFEKSNLLAEREGQ